MVTFAIKGLQRLQRNLQNLAKLQGFDAELDHSAKVISQIAAENIDHMVAGKSGTKLSASLRVTTGGKEFSRLIGSAIKYAAFIEFGTTHTPARPWLSSALATEKPAILKRMSNLLLRNASQKNIAGTNPTTNED